MNAYGQNATAISYGGLQITATAGQAVQLASVGDLLATAQAGTDLWALADGKLDGTYTATGDVVDVETGGDIGSLATTTFTAGHSIG